MPNKNFIPAKDRRWIDARQKFHLSHAQIQMARELGMNPEGFGKLANHKQERWKAPLPEFIEQLYFKRFGKTQPSSVESIEEIVRKRRDKKAKTKQSNTSKVDHDSVATVDFDYF